MRPQFWPVLISAALAIGVWAVFFQVRNHNFISFDDNSYILSNEHVKTGLRLENITYFFKHGYVGNYHPLTSISHMLDVELFGLNPAGHHLTNVVLHALNSAGLFLVLFFMTGRLWPSAFVAAVFAFHPLRVESVAWASERKDVLSAFFWILTLGAYVYYVHKKSVLSYLPVIFFYILAALAKPMVVTLPFLMLLLDYWPLGRYALPEDEPSNSKYILKRLGVLVLEKIPLFAIAIAASAITFFVQQSAGLAKSAAEFPLQWRFWNMFYSYARYIGKLIWPADLSIFYPAFALIWWQIAASIVLLISISSIALCQWKKRPYIIVGWLWFIGMLIPVIGVVQVGLQSIADRYTYIPLIGIVILVTWAVSELIKTNKAKYAAAASAALIVVAFIAAQYKQVGYWQNNENLYSHAAKAVKGNWWAYDFLGREYAAQGRNQEAVDCFRKSLQISEDNVNVKVQLGNTLLAMGKPDEASAVFESALPALPANAEQVDFGNILQEPSSRGEIVRAYVDAHFGCADAYMRKGDFDNAIKHYKEILRVVPGSIQIYKVLGGIYVVKGDMDEAAKQYVQMLKLKPDEIAVINEICYNLNEQNKMSQAESLLRKMIEILPDNADLHSSLGITLGRETRFSEAEQELRKALALQPLSSEIESNLGFALACQNNIPEAINHFERAVQLDPQNEIAKAHLAKVKQYLNSQGK